MAAGDVISTVGAVFPAVTVWVAVPVRPLSSMAWSFTVTAPLAEYVHCGVALVESSYWPSPSRSHA